MSGGKRLGAGRPRGACNKRRKIKSLCAQAEGISPLDVMLHTMRLHYKAGRYDAAASIAKDCAPYLHPRLASVEHAGLSGAALGPAIVTVEFIHPLPQPLTEGEEL